MTGLRTSFITTWMYDTSCTNKRQIVSGSSARWRGCFPSTIGSIRCWMEGGCLPLSIDAATTLHWGRMETLCNVVNDDEGFGYLEPKPPFLFEQAIPITSTRNSHHYVVEAEVKTKCLYSKSVLKMKDVFDLSSSISGIFGMPYNLLCGYK